MIEDYSVSGETGSVREIGSLQLPEPAFHGGDAQGGMVQPIEALREESRPHYPDTITGSAALTLAASHRGKRVGGSNQSFMAHP